MDQQIASSVNKKQRLANLKKRMVEDSSLPLRDGATQLVFGDGNPDTEIYFLGEAPGFYEDQQGKPFVGQAGKLLDKLIESIGLKRSDVYISNVVRFRPPQNRDPLPEEIAAFQPYVDEEIEIINPKLFVTLGRFSMGKFLPEAKISQVHGQIKKAFWSFGKAQDKKEKIVTVIPMYHPAAALRNGAVMQQFEEDFKKIPQALEDVKKAGSEGNVGGGELSQPEEKASEPDKPEQLNLL